MSTCTVPYTTGDRPLRESMRLYTKKAAELLKELAEREGDKTKTAEASGPQDSEAFDVSSKDREFYTMQRAEQVLAPLLAKGAKFTKVKLSTKSFGIDAAKVVARAFANLAPTLKEVDLSDIIAGRPEVEALKAMEMISEATVAAKITGVLCVWRQNLPHACRGFFSFSYNESSNGARAVMLAFCDWAQKSIFFFFFVHFV